MADNKLVYLPAKHYKTVVAPEGRSRASALAAEVWNDYEFLQYGTPSFNKGVYGRIVGSYDSPTKTGKPLVAVTTFKYSPEHIGKEEESHIFLVEIDKIEEVDETSELLKALGNETVLIARVEPPKPKTFKEELNECLDVVYPDRYDWQGHSLIIHFPKFTITNKNKTHREITDLFVRIDFNYQYNKFTSTLYGRRLSLSEEEAVAHYTHSHLPSGYEWNTFCLGSTEFADLFTDFMTSNIDLDKFTVLLHWIGEYVKWESLDGGPYFRMSDIKSRTTARLPRASTSNYAYSFSDIRRCVNNLLEALKPEDIFMLINADGTSRWSIEPTACDRLWKVLNTKWEGPKTNFDEITKELVSTGDSSNNIEGHIRRFEQSTQLIFKGNVVKPKVVGRTEEEVKRSIIRIIPPSVVSIAFNEAEVMLNRQPEAYYYKPGVTI